MFARRDRGGRPAARCADGEHGALRGRRDRRSSSAAGDAAGVAQRAGRRRASSSTATTVAARDLAHAAGRRASTATTTWPGTTAAMLRELGFRCAVAAPVKLGGRLWGAVIVSTRAGTSRSRRAPSSGWPTSPSSSRWRSPTPRRARELAASRARIVEAGDAERRRLERNLHDGAQQRLVALSLNLRLAERTLAEPDAESPRAAFERAGRRARRGARGAARARARHPSRRPHRPRAGAGARDAGGARERPGRASRSSSTSRLPEPVEAAAYYIVAEALTNAAKHARRPSVRCGSTRDGRLRACVEVADDGVGGADHARRLGPARARRPRRGARRRAELESPTGAGTTLRARLPVR